MDHLGVRDTASNPKAATLHTVGTGYKRQTRAGKADPWWLVTLSTSKLHSKLSTMRKVMARQSIGDSKQTIVKTIPRRGYRFTAPVLRLATGAGAAPQPALPPAESPPAWSD